MYYKCRISYAVQHCKISLNSSGLYSMKGWEKLKADISANFGTDSLLHMLYKLLNGNLSILGHNEFPK